MVWTAPASRRRLPRQGSPAGSAPQRYMISGPEAAPVGRDPPPRTTPDCRSGGSRGGGRGRGCLRKDGSRRQHPRKTSGSRRESRPNRGGSRLEAARAAGGTCRGHDGARRRHAAQQPSPAMARVLPRPARSTGSPSQPLRALLPRRSAAAARWRLQCRVTALLGCTVTQLLPRSQRAELDRDEAAEQKEQELATKAAKSRLRVEAVQYSQSTLSVNCTCGVC